MIQLAASLDLTTVAEIIDSEAAAAALKAMGCRYGQGYYFSPPLESAARLREAACPAAPRAPAQLAAAPTRTAVEQKPGANSRHAPACRTPPSWGPPETVIVRAPGRTPRLQETVIVHAPLDSLLHHRSVDRESSTSAKMGTTRRMTRNEPHPKAPRSSTQMPRGAVGAVLRDEAGANR